MGASLLELAWLTRVLFSLYRITRTASNTATHVGRGGAANVIKGANGEAAAPTTEKPKTKKEGGLLAKIKAMLGSK